MSTATEDRHFRPSGLDGAKRLGVGTASKRVTRFLTTMQEKSSARNVRRGLDMNVRDSMFPAKKAGWCDRCGATWNKRDYVGKSLGVLVCERCWKLAFLERQMVMLKKYR